MIYNPTTVEEFNKLINNDLVLIDFWRASCGPCVALAPVLDQVSIALPSLVIVKVNVDILRELAIQYQVRSIPDLRWLKQGVQVKAHTGIVSAAIIKQTTAALA